MDKTKLSYIVSKGTNSRILNVDKTVLIVDETGKEGQSKWCDPMKYEFITIAEYEKKFVELKEEKKYEICPNCGYDSVPYLSDECPKCGKEFVAWSDNKGNIIKRYDS